MATFKFLRRSEALGTPPYGSGYVANPPIGGPLLISFPGLSNARPAERLASRSQSAHLRATFDFVPRSKELVIPPNGRSYVPGAPTSKSLHIFSLAVTRWAQPSFQRLCSEFAHLWATCDFVPPFEAWMTPNGRG